MSGIPRLCARVAADVLLSGPLPAAPNNFNGDDGHTDDDHTDDDHSNNDAYDHHADNHNSVSTVHSRLGC